MGTLANASLRPYEPDQDFDAMFAITREIVSLPPFEEARLELMAYPFGERDDFDATSKEVAREAGYRAAFAAYRGLFGSATDLFEIPRLATRQEFDRFRVGTARLHPAR